MSGDERQAIKYRPLKDIVEDIKLHKPSCTAIFKRFFRDNHVEKGNCVCPFHEDKTPSMQVDDEFAFCHAGCGKFDAIDLYVKGRESELSKPEAIREFAKELGIGVERTLPLSDAAIQCLKSRWIVKTVDRFVRAGAHSLDGNPAKGWKPSICVPLADWNGRPLGKQFLPLDGGEKKFKTGTPATKAFFHLAGTGPVIVTEGIYDALSVAEAIPGADVCAILSANFTDKLSSLKGREVVLFLDNDGPGRKGNSKAESLLAGICQLRSVDWALSPNGAKDPNDLLKAGHVEVIREMVEKADHVHPLKDGSDKKPDDDIFSTARSFFPRIPFPWEILPSELSESLQQLARACATSSTPLPGTCFALIAAAVGCNFSVCPKFGWSEPSITWIGDIRESGDGKTPATRILCEKIEDLQREEHRRFDAETEHFNGLPKKDREAAIPPTKPRGFFLTGMTLEGLRDDLHGHPTGGLIVIQDELSAFVSAQNQYKGGKGDDRESWLKFFDGHDARIGRSKQSILITGARPSLVGGIQPAIFRKAFMSEDGVYLSDGTIFRFLLTYDRSQHYPLTKEVWADHNRHAWENILTRAFYWTDKNEPIRAIFDSQAQEHFFDWRNDLDSQKCELPSILKGFIPKAVSYAARLTGIIHCVHAFHQGEEPDRILTLMDVQRGIRAVEFYLGQIVDAMQLIEDEEHKPVDERALVLAQVLDGLRGEVDSGRLAIGFIMDRFNSVVLDHRTFKTPHAFGAFLRECKLNVSEGKHDANGKRASKCLLWDEKAEIFIKESLQCLHSLQSKTEKRFADADIDVCKSALSAISFPTDFNPDEMQTLQTLKNECLHPQISTEQRVTDIADNADIVSTEKNENDLEYEGEI